MRNYVERAKDFIKEIYPYLDGEWYCPWDVEKRVNVFNAENNRKVKTSSGISRIALITSDYVVKYDYDPSELSNVGGCEIEMEVYEQAKRAGFAYMFAEITPYEYNEHQFYIMPRIYGIGRNEDAYADEYMTEEEEEFCDRIGLTDLHCNNYGFRKNHVCLVDYACSTIYLDDEEYMS